MAASTDDVIQRFLSLTASAAPVEAIGALFDEAVDFYVAGDVTVVPWIGRKVGQAGAADFYRQIRELIISEKFTVSQVLVQGERAVILGELASRVRSTGKLIESEFAFDLTVRDGLIQRFRMFEDSFAVAQAAA